MEDAGVKEVDAEFLVPDVPVENVAREQAPRDICVGTVVGTEGEGEGRNKDEEGDTGDDEASAEFSVARCVSG